MAGSQSPERVPMMRPSRGVRPIEVSKEQPSFTALIEEPLPMCAMIRLVLKGSWPRRTAARLAVYRKLVPWKP
jgi:hypothetical protein